jgi:putative transposase
MSANYFSTGCQFRWNGVLFETKRLLPNDEINIENISTGMMLIESLSKLVSELFAGELNFEMNPGRLNKKSNSGKQSKLIDLSDFPEHLVSIARYRHSVIKPLVDMDPSDRTLEAVKMRVDELKADPSLSLSNHNLSNALGWRTAYRWMKTYLGSGGDLRSLIPDTRERGGKGKSRLVNNADALVDSIIRDHYYRPEKVTVKDITCIVAARVEEENRGRPPAVMIKTPSVSTINRRINALDMRERYSVKHGKRAARQHFTQYEQMEYPTLPLERVEIDHTKLDGIVFDEKDGLPMGRPTLTHCLDLATRYPLGYYLGFEPPSCLTVSECLYNAICPKQDTQELFGTEHLWLAYGIPQMLVIDNGREFIGKDLSDSCEALGIDLQYSPVRTPEFKAGIERMFRTLNSGLFHKLPGTTFSNPQEKGDYDSLMKSCISLSDLEKMLNIFIVDDYAQRFHKGLNDIPARRWETAMSKLVSPGLPTDRDGLQILLGRTAWRMIHHYGIEFECLRFNTPELASLRNRSRGKMVKIKYRPSDLSRIFVFDEDDDLYIEVPALARDYVDGLSLWKHRVILNQARKDGPIVDLAALGRAKLKVQSIVDAARDRKRVATRSRIARWDGPKALQKKARINEPAEYPQKPPKTGPLEPVAEDMDVIPQADETEGWELAYSLFKPKSTSISKLEGSK